jgi:hypothetical protein
LFKNRDLGWNKCFYFVCWLFRINRWGSCIRMSCAPMFLLGGYCTLLFWELNSNRDFLLFGRILNSLMFVSLRSLEFSFQMELYLRAGKELFRILRMTRHLFLQGLLWREISFQRVYDRLFRLWLAGNLLILERKNFALFETFYGYFFDLWINLK